MNLVDATGENPYIFALITAGIACGAYDLFSSWSAVQAMDDFMAAQRAYYDALNREMLCDDYQPDILQDMKEQFQKEIVLYHAEQNARGTNRDISVKSVCAAAAQIFALLAAFL